MNVRCPSCQTVYRIDPSQVPPSGVLARCASCGAVISVPRPVHGLEPSPAQGRPGPVTEPLEAAAPDLTPAAAPPAGPTAESVSPGAPAEEAPPQPEPQPAAPPRPRYSRPFAQPRPEPPARDEPRRTRPWPTAPVFRPTPGTPVQPMSAAEPSDEPLEGRRVQPEEPRTSPQRPTSPFLSQDPRQKAHRLARALVSDMIVYQPRKRQEAIERGTLKDEFEEAIKQSWEEYVQQVGEELANSTPYFTEALNDILAGGRKIF